MEALYLGCVNLEENFPIISTYRILNIAVICKICKTFLEF